MKKLTSYMIVFIIGCLLSWYITSINVKPEVIVKKQIEYINKLENKIDVAKAKEKESKFLWIIPKDNIIWCAIGYGAALL